MTDFDLLNQYLAGSQEAFAELVNRHIHWLFSVCRRQVGDAALAEDVVQAAFITLAKKAPALSSSTSISGWLFLTSRYAAKSALKIEQRRQRHERQAANMKHETIPPADISNRVDIEAALATLSDPDRQALVLRFFQSLTHESIAQTLGISKHAAQKRVDRALDRLRKKLGAAETAPAAGAIVSLLSAHAGQTAPAELAAKSLLAGKSASSISAGAQAIVKEMAAMKKAFALKIAFSAIAASLLTGIAIVLAAQSKPSEPTQRIGKFDLSSVQVIRLTGTPVGNIHWMNYYSRKNNQTIHELSAPAWSTTHYFSGETESDYRHGGSLVLCKTPMTDASAQLRKTELDLSSVQNAPATRRPDLDQTIDGNPCQAFHLQDSPGQSKNAFVYISTTSGRPMRIKSDGPVADVTVSYDPPLASDLFKIPSGPGIETIGARDYLEKKYPLAGAVYRWEGLGQIFTVNEATRDALGCFHIICSTRLTPEVRTALASVPDDQVLIKFQTADRAKFPFYYVTLAQLRQSGMQITYLLAIPKNPQAAGNVCQLPIEIGSSDEVLNSGHAARSPDGGRDSHLAIKLKIAPLQIQSPEQFAGEAYDAVSPLVGMLQETTIIGPNNDRLSRQDTIDETRRKLVELLPR